MDLISLLILLIVVGMLLNVVVISVLLIWMLWTFTRPTRCEEKACSHTK